MSGVDARGPTAALLHLFPAGALAHALLRERCPALVPPPGELDELDVAQVAAPSEHELFFVAVLSRTPLPAPPEPS